MLTTEHCYLKSREQVEALMQGDYIREPSLKHWYSL